MKVGSTVTWPVKAPLPYEQNEESSKVTQPNAQLHRTERYTSRSAVYEDDRESELEHPWFEVSQLLCADGWALHPA